MAQWQWLREHAAPLGAAACVGAVAILFAGQAALSPLVDLWNDELYSLWATDPAAPLSRLAGDSNPPLYYALLWLVRFVFDTPQAAFFAVNAIALIASSLFVVWSARRANAPALGWFSVAVLCAAGPAMFLFQDGRAFYLSVCIAFCASWRTALLIDQPATPRDLIWLAVLAVLAAYAHLYTALLLGCLAAGLVTLAVFGRRDLLTPGLVLGLTVSVALASWLAIAFGRAGNIGWIVFTREAVFAALWYARTIAIGPTLMLAPLAVILGAGLMLERTRPLVLAFAIAGVLFIALPLAASFFVPMIQGRYWSIGAAALSVLVLFLARAFFDVRTQRFALVGALASAFLTATIVTGYFAARQFMRIEPVWAGAAVVREAARDCGEGTIRVNGQPDLFAIASGLPPAIFEQAEGMPVRAASETQCPVLGWVEHDLSGADSPTDAELLATLGLTAAPEAVRIDRRDSGYVVLRQSDP